MGFFEDLPQPPEPDEDAMVDGVQPPWQGPILNAMKAQQREPHGVGAPVPVVGRLR